MIWHASRALGLAILLCAGTAMAIPRTYDIGPNLEDNFFDTSSVFDSTFYANLGVVPSVDGAHVYVASGAVIEVLEADPISNKLRVVQEIRDGDAGGAPVVQAQAIAISPDDAHVYVADRFAPALSVFERDALTGQLTYVESQVNGMGGVTGLDRPSAVIVSPDGSHVYVASGYPSLGAVFVFSRNVLTGALSYVQKVSDGGTGGPSLQSPEEIALSPDGLHLYAAAGFDSSVSVFSRNVTTGALTFVEAHVDGVSGVDGLGTAQGVTVSPDGAHVYATGYTDNRVAMFGRNASTGALTFIGATPLVPGASDGLAGIVLDATGTHAYAAHRGVAEFTRNPGTGVLTFVQAFSGIASDLSESYDVALSPDGGHLYATGYQGGGLTTFERDAGTGSLSYLQRWRPTFSRIGLSRVGGVVVSPDGEHVYATGAEEGAVVVTSRNPSTGALTFADRITDGFDGASGLLGASDTVISPDGAYVYVASTDSDSVTAFARDSVTGALTQVDQEIDGVGPVDGLDEVRALAISPDGAHVYAGGRTAVAVFARNLVTGEITFVESDAANTVDDLALSPDGGQLYASAYSGNVLGEVTAWTRNGLTGALTALDSYALPPKTLSPGTVAVSPDGANVYTTVATTLVSFARDAGTGSLTEIGQQENGSDGIGFDALKGPRALLVTADGSSVLVANASYGGDHETVGAFYRSPVDGRALFLQAVEYPWTALFSFGDEPRSGALAETPDGSHVYWGRDESHALTTLVAGFTGCDAAPRVGCRTPGESGRALVKFLDNAGTSGDLISWRWQAAGEATAPGDFGDPRATTNYALCAYDESGPPALVFRALAPAGAERWKAVEVGPSDNAVLIGYKMKDKQRAPEGLSTLVMKAKMVGNAKMKLKGKGDLLTLPVVPPPLPLRVQLQADGGTCWEAVFSNAGVVTSAPGKFIAKSD